MLGKRNTGQGQAGRRLKGASRQRNYIARCNHITKIASECQLVVNEKRHDDEVTVR